VKARQDMREVIAASTISQWFMGRIFT